MDANGRCTEGLQSNFFAVVRREGKDVLLTAPDEMVLAGTVRKVVLASALRAVVLAWKSTAILGIAR